MSSFDRFQPPPDGRCIGRCTACGGRVYSDDSRDEITALSERGLCLVCFEDECMREEAEIIEALECDPEFNSVCDERREAAIEHMEHAIAADWLRTVSFTVAVAS